MALGGGAAEVRWGPSSDNRAMGHYRVFRDDVYLGTVTHPPYEDLGVEIGEEYVYQVRAVDAAGNASTLSENAYLDASWTTEVLDDTGWVAVGVALAADSQGHAHIAYYDVTRQRLRYGTNAGGSWWIYDLLAGPGNDRSTAATLRLDAEDVVHLAFVNPNTGDLTYGRLVSSSWSFEVVDARGGLRASNLDLAVGRDGRVHIAYLSNSEPALYAVRQEGTWTAGWIPGLKVYACRTSIALDGFGAVHLALSRSGSTPGGVATAEVLHASNESGRWAYELVRVLGLESDLDLCQTSTVAIDSFNNVLVALGDDALSRPRWLATREGITWSFEEIPILGRPTGFALGVGDSRHFAALAHWAYGCAPHGRVYLTDETGGWRKYRIDETWTVGDHVALAIDANGYVHLAYLLDTHPTYATNRP